MDPRPPNPFPDEPAPTSLVHPDPPASAEERRVPAAPPVSLESSPSAGRGTSRRPAGERNGVPIRSFPPVLEKLRALPTWGKATVGAVGFLMLVGAFFFPVRSWFQPLQKTPQPKLVDIPRGASLTRIAHLLALQGLIRREAAFIWLARRQGRAGQLHPGRYLLSPHQTPQAILDQLVAAKVATVKIVFPEGFTLEQMAVRMQARGLGRADRYRDLATREAGSFGVKGLPPGGSLEGYLFPDTYEVPWGADERALIRLQLERFEQVWAALAAKYPQPRSRHEVVTLASLIEREAKVEADRRLISGVLHNRLARGLRLEVDATVLYALGQHRSRLLYRDLQVDSPYNTYLRAGLPPGPIANPGRASLEAALDPAPTDCLYYVARPDGSHLFSRTLAAHNRAKRAVRQAAGD
jgi:UPF0755 protein